MSADKIQLLRKELKQWESAFFVVHQRKPGKDDIASAPNDVKDKYQHYFKEKKKAEQNGNKKTNEPQTGHFQYSQPSEVWGPEFNKVASSQPQVIPTLKTSDQSGNSSLSKLGAKLFQKFADAKSPHSLDSKKGKPVYERKPMSAKHEIGHSDKSKKTDVQNASFNRCKSPDAGRESNKTDNVDGCDNDFVINSELFQTAQKLFSPSLENSAARRTSAIASKPRLSFLSVQRPISLKNNFDLGDNSNEDNDFLEDFSTAYLKEPSINGHYVKNSPRLTGTNTEKEDTQIQIVYRENTFTHKSQVCENKKNKHKVTVEDEEYFMNQLCVESKTVSDNEPGSTFNISKHVSPVSVSSQNVSLSMKNSSSYRKHPSEAETNCDETNVEKTEASRLSPSLRDKSPRQPSISKIPEKLSNKRGSEKLAEDAYDFLASETSAIPDTHKSMREKKGSDIKARKSRKAPQARSRLPTKDAGSGINDTSCLIDPASVKNSKTTRGKKRKQIISSPDESYEDNTPDPHQESSSKLDLPVSSPLVKATTKKPTKSKRSAASLNENYVCLNMKCKGYRHKGGGMTGAQLRRKQWKSKMAARSQSFGKNKCFKCGQEGHWANKCTGQGKKENWNVSEEQPLPMDESEFPSLREAALMSRGVKGQAEEGKSADDITDIEATIVRESWQTTAPPSTKLPPLADVVEDVNQEMQQALAFFGHSSFRPGQEDCVSRILRGLSTLVILSTGSGKSLCYQLPAYLYAKHQKALTLVVSPLVSLMEDQITGLPPGVNGACLHSSMSPAQRESVVTSLKEGRVHFLLVSPEAVVEKGGGTKQGSFPPPNMLPPIAFACIDEAHCLSEWSHNFRPSYLRLCKVLRQRYGVTCFLGLTATATRFTAADVVKHLGIQDSTAATIRGAMVPKNLVLSASRDEMRDQALINLLKGNRFKSCESILIYCSRREHTERVATLIRTSMQKTESLTSTSIEPLPKRQRVSKKAAFDPSIWTTESYHAGLSAAKRRSVQKAFMSGKLRVVVATVAFGMGLDKADVRAVIHYNMAKSFESYVQEIGRAGRDGLPSHCHVFLDSENKDLCELKRHTFSNSVDRVTLKRLLTKVFKPCRCGDIYRRTRQDKTTRKDTTIEPPGEDATADPHSINSGACHSDRTMPSEVNDSVCGGHERALSIQETVQYLDIREEGIQTLLSYLELHPERWVENLNPVYSRCKIRCYKGPGQLMAVAKKCPPIAVAVAKQKLEGKHFAGSNELEFHVIEICDSMGWDSGTVKRELFSLQWELGPYGAQKTGVSVELSDLAFHFRSRGDLTAKEMDTVVDFLHGRAQQQERAELRQLVLLSESLRSVSHKNYWMCCDEADMEKSEKLKGIIRKYFDDNDLEIIEKPEEKMDPSTLNYLVADIRSFISIYGSDHTLTGRAIARIFHGIESPNFPAKTWGRVRKFWRAHLNVDFNLVIKEATRILVSMK